MWRAIAWSSVLALGLVASQPLTLFAASPALSNIRPVGGQRGTEVDVTFAGQRLADVQEILFLTPGLETIELGEIKDNQVKAKLRIKPDCRPGEHAMRLRSKTGVSELKTFHVGVYPEVKEVEPNTEFETPQRVELNVTVNGVVQPEDVDYYVVALKKGQRLNVEIEGLRLANTLFDPYLAIVDDKRFELATADDTPLLFQDSAVGIIAPEDGDYRILVRDSAYGGNGASLYRLYIGEFPRPLAVYPAGGKAGETQQVKYLGDPAGEFVQSITLPPQVGAEFGAMPEQEGRLTPSALPFRVSDFGNTLEQEPNDQNEQATRSELPLALNGVLGQPGDVDTFRITAKKGEVWDVNVYGRRIRSAIDPVLTIIRGDGKGNVGQNDDSGKSPDSYLKFNVPADGEYLIQVRDHLKRGGPAFVYRVEFTKSTPVVNLTIPQYARYSQERHAVAVPRNGRYATLLNVDKQNFAEEMLLDPATLPAGVTMTAPPIPRNMNVIPVLFEATADAPLAAAIGPLTASNKEKGVTGAYRQSADLVLGPNQSVMWQYETPLLAVAVTEELPFKIDLIEPKVPLVQNGTMNLKVVATRKEGFKGPIVLQFPFKPNGMNAGSSVTIPEGQTEAFYPINASGGAEVRSWQVLVIGSTDVGGKLWAATNFINLNVIAPMVTVQLRRDAVEQGQTGELVAKVEVQTPFEGTAKIKLVGLPDKITSPELELNKDTKELIFKAETTAESPVGKHQNLFCQITFMQHDEPIVHSQGKAELQVDKPIPPKNPPAAPAQPVAQAAPAPMPAAPPAEKKLSRLEKLRVEAAERAKAEAEAKK